MKYYTAILILMTFAISCSVESNSSQEEVLLRIEERLDKIEKELAKKETNSSPIKKEAVKTRLSEEELEAYIEQIESGHMPNEKLKTAKRLCRNLELKSSQVRDIVSVLFSSPTQKSFAKYAYKRTIDKENYNLVIELFHFMGKGELEDFIAE